MKLDSLLPSVAKMELVHPVMGATGITLSLIGQDTKPFRDKAKAIAKGMVGKSNKDVDLDALEQQNLELAATCIVGWSDPEAFGEYSPQQALVIISMPELHYLKEQVEEFIADRKNFFRPVSDLS